jgi:RHS repeat-associated protein
MFGDAIDQIFARVSNSGTAAWYLTDIRGSVMDLTDGSGTVQDTLSYDAWGKVLSESTATFGDRYKWAGREYDPSNVVSGSLGLYYNRARDYSSILHRFIGQDPSGFDAGDSNLYRYTQNSPTNGTDPSGLIQIPSLSPIDQLRSQTDRYLSLKDNVYSWREAGDAYAAIQSSLAQMGIPGGASGPGYTASYTQLDPSARFDYWLAYRQYENEAGTNWSTGIPDWGVLQDQIGQLRAEYLQEAKQTGKSEADVKKTAPFLFEGPDQSRYFRPDYSSGYLDFKPTAALRELQLRQALMVGVYVTGRETDNFGVKYSRTIPDTWGWQVPFSAPKTDEQSLAWFLQYGTTEPGKLINNQKYVEGLEDSSGDLAVLSPVGALRMAGAAGFRQVLGRAAGEVLVNGAIWAATEMIAERWGAAGAVGAQLAPTLFALLRRRLPRLRRPAPEYPVRTNPLTGQLEELRPSNGGTGPNRWQRVDRTPAPGELRRPYIRDEVRAEVQRRAPRDAQGRLLDPNTGEVIQGTPDLGHRPGNEFWRERARAQTEGLTQQQFNDRMNNPDLYQLESPSSNRSHRYELPR